MKQPKRPSMKMQQVGHYRPPQLPNPGHYNRPGVGRIGKSMPSMKQFRPLMGPARPVAGRPARPAGGRYRVR